MTSHHQNLHPTVTQRTSRGTAHYPSPSLIQMRQNLPEEKGEIIVGHSERSQHAREATARKPQTADTTHDEPPRVTQP